MVGADTWGVEVIPFESKNVFEVHQILLPMKRHLHPREHEHGGDGEGQGLGVPVHARARRASPAAVQGIINPIAIR